ncbi:MAG TPA: MGMT family protein [Nitrososphaerales archaeon]|nr:MGMT family protein [Nitrososphaerales archaeon]HUK75894.1 MGMT family protein [Nitrososphaerales archaeon]
MKPLSFNQSVYAMAALVPMGKVTTYGAIAKAIGSPRAARAVGNALGANTNPIVVPCHRVVRADGGLGGYSGGDGPATKAKLLGREGVRVSAGRVSLDQYLFTDF